MPELPEVETVRRELGPWLTGRTILEARRVEAPAGPKYANLARASGQRILDVSRRGKFLLLPLSGGDELVVHLGMTGVISPEKPAGHLRVELVLSGPQPDRLYFRDARRFGRFLVVRAGAYAALPTLAALGPEPFDPAFTDEVFAASLARSRGPVKPLLLSQRIVAGLGNIYVDEALFEVGVHPLRPANRVTPSEAAALRRASIAILERAIAHRGTTFSDYRTVNGQVGEYASRLAVYAHEGEPCPRCGTAIEKLVVGQRGTHFCPACQSAPRKKRTRRPSPRPAR
ncbi:MAG: bifunctional DNA-formamidopyrimidine glycosylase/DNA-(apurinic or apyrimidinic site) lyase [Deltaproteobacteria bacterium]|nr:bifunctional DNA-formamidopyrimidine glycosylase/DNA-(apurinic or apyrimidinic site) lyase [Deltaproteobacteria bacterium]